MERGTQTKLVVALFVVGGLVAVGAVVGGVSLLRSALEVERTVYTDPTEEELLAFATRLASTLDGDGVAYAEQFDTREMALRIVPATAGYRRQGFARGFQSAAPARGLFNSIQESVEAGARYDFRGIAQRDGEAVVRFRLLFPGLGGVNFHDYLVKRDAQGHLRCLDLFIMVQGQYLSEVMRAMLGADGALNDGGGIARMQAALESGQYQQALDEYARLPEAVRYSVGVQMLRVQAAIELGDDVYLSTLEDAMTRIPDNVALTTMSIDAHALRGQWQEVLTAVERLNEVFPDAYWDLMAATALLAMGDLDGASVRVERALAREDELAEAHETALEVAVANNDVDRASRELVSLRDRFSYDRERFRTTGTEDVLENHPSLLALLPAP